MKYFVKKSVLLLLVVLAFCACDNSNDNGEVIQPNPQSVSYTHLLCFFCRGRLLLFVPPLVVECSTDGGTELRIFRYSESYAV